MPDSLDHSDSFARSFAPFAILAAIVAGVHGRYATFRFTSLDDLTLIVDDLHFLSAHDAPWRAFGRSYFHIVDAAHPYYRPVVTASYALDARLFGAEPAGYHVTNVLLHLVATWLVHALLLRANLRKDISRLGSLVFAVHPALVQSVAWLPGRNDSLFAIFALLAIVTHARVCASAHRAIVWRAAHIASFAFAMFTKETAIIVPLASIGWTQLVERDDAAARAHRNRVATWATCAGWTGVLAVFGYARHRAVTVASDAPPLIDWHAPIDHLSVLVSSVGKILFPVDLAPIATLDDTSNWIGVAAMIALAAAMFIVRRGGSLRMPVIAFGASLYLFALVPTLFTHGSLVLENRLYVPTVGILLVVGELADKAGIERRLVATFGSIMVLVFAAFTFGYAGAYRDPLNFGRAAVAGSPHSALAHFTLGQARHRNGELDAAVAEYTNALTLDANEPIVHNNLGILAMRRHDWKRAESELEAELQVNPGYPIALHNLSIVKRRLTEQ